MVIKIIKYAGTNATAFVVDFAVLLALDYYTDINRAYTSFFCYLLGTCVSFVLAKNFVFGTARSPAPSLPPGPPPDATTAWTRTDPGGRRHRRHPGPRSARRGTR